MENVPIELVIPYDIKAKKEAFLRRSGFMYLIAVLYAAYELYLFLPALRFLPYLAARDLILYGFVVLVAVMLFTLPHFIFYRSLRRTKKLYPNGLPEVKMTFGDTIVGVYGGNRVEYQYDWIVRTKKYRRSYILVLKSRQQIALPYNSFAKGDLESLKALLREKCPGVKIVD